MALHNRLGSDGESIARSFLEKKGYSILAQNWRYRKLEIDIIAQKDNLLVIIEVKTRSSNAFGYPESFVSQRKMQNLIEAAAAYIEEKEINAGIRFDVIAITKTKQGTNIEHFEDAFNSIHAFGL